MPLGGFHKVHGSLARAGKVKSQTPKVEKQEKKKTPKGRAKKRIIYNRRYVVSVLTSISSETHPQCPQLRQCHRRSWRQASNVSSYSISPA
jgi:small subunit ribosomal protein S30e